MKIFFPQGKMVLEYVFDMREIPIVKNVRKRVCFYGIEIYVGQLDMQLSRI